jgi:hypothetical protein
VTNIRLTNDIEELRKLVQDLTLSLSDSERKNRVYLPGSVAAMDMNLRDNFIQSCNDQLTCGLFVKTEYSII